MSRSKGSGERPLTSRYPYLWLDAKVEKVRAGGRVERRALVVAYGVDATGQREVISLDVGAVGLTGQQQPSQFTPDWRRTAIRQPPYRAVALRPR